jgi:hypothetical protein
LSCCDKYTVFVFVICPNKSSVPTLKIEDFNWSPLFLQVLHFKYVLVLDDVFNAGIYGCRHGDPEQVIADGKVSNH